MNQESFYKEVATTAMFTHKEVTSTVIRCLSTDAVLNKLPCTKVTGINGHLYLTLTRWLYVTTVIFLIVSAKGILGSGELR